MSKKRILTTNFSLYMLWCFYRVINGWMKDRCVDVFSVLSHVDNGQIGWKKYAACWNSRVPVNFRVSGINSRDVESGAVSLAFVCLVDFYLILITVKCVQFFCAIKLFRRNLSSYSDCNVHVLCLSFNWIGIASLFKERLD